MSSRSFPKLPEAIVKNVTRPETVDDHERVNQLRTTLLAIDPTKPLGALLFDFFGTLVEYQPDRIAHEYPRTYDLAASFGFRGSYDEFTFTWDAVTSELEADSRRTLHEFDMADAARRFVERAGLTLPTDSHRKLGASYVAEWQRHVVPVPGVADMLARLAARWRMAVVSNTHDSDMVPRLLSTMGVATHFDTVVLSVEHGRCKPHDSIYQCALDRLGVTSDEAVFIGDNAEADYIGPDRFGLRAFLIDAHSTQPVPAERRLHSVLDLEAKLAEPR